MDPSEHKRRQLSIRESIATPGLAFPGILHYLHHILELRFLPTRWTLALPLLSLFSAVVLGAALIGIGTLAWHLTGDADFFIAGLVWGLVLEGALAAGLILART